LAAGRREGVEVDRDQVYGLQVMLLQLGHLAGVITFREYAGVDAGVQGLDAPVQYLGETRQVAHRVGRDPRLLQPRLRAAGSEDVHAHLAEGFTEGFESRGVGYADDSVNRCGV